MSAAPQAAHAPQVEGLPFEQERPVAPEPAAQAAPDHGATVAAGASDVCGVGHSPGYCPTRSVDAGSAAIAGLAGGPGTAEQTRDRATDYGQELFHQAVLLGFALARTWPDRPEGREGWPRRALPLAGIPTVAATDDGEEHDR
jgi:hypothetical protein